MEFLCTGALFSRQGRATLHQFPGLYLGPKKAPVAGPPKEGGVTDLPEPAAQLSYSFRAVSRDQRSFAFRNKTEAPKSTQYRPRFEVISRRTDQSPTYHPDPVQSKPRPVCLPGCLDKSLTCTHGSKKLHKLRKPRTISLETLQRRREQRRLVEAPPAVRVPDFDKMTERPPFVKASSNPEYSEPFVPSSRPVTVDISKTLP